MSLMVQARSKRLLPALLAGAVLSGCGSTQVIVESDFPTPLIEPLPLRMGVMIPDELYNFI